MPLRVFTYGSCVARDVIRVCEDRFNLADHFARSSWISAAGAPVALPSVPSKLTSKFQQRMVERDFQSATLDALRCTNADVILLDLIDERNGVYPADAGGYMTWLNEQGRSGWVGATPRGGLIRFGTQQHLELFTDAVSRVVEIIGNRPALLIRAEFTDVTSEGGQVRPEQGLPASVWNERFAPYYAAAADAGIRVLEMPRNLTLSTESHKWGPAPYHYVDAFYHHVGREIEAMSEAMKSTAPIRSATARSLIGVTGIARRLPLSFPLTTPENSGNIIHGSAPFRMFRGAHFSVDRDWPTYASQPGFREFVNTHASHLIVTQANLLRLGDHSDTMRRRYSYFQSALEGYDVPIVLFGLGAQSRDSALQEGQLPDEAIELMKFLGERCAAISVRGQFTADVFKFFAGVTNTHVTGCPSFFSNPTAFTALRERVRSTPNRFAYSPTHLQREYEQELLGAAIDIDAFHVEPVSKDLHSFHLKLAANEQPDLPRDLQPLVTETRSRSVIESHFRNRYRLFRHVDDWLDFNAEYIDFTYGPRFHVNMASLLSGVPALWLTHDSGTRELTDALSLPNIPAEDAAKLHPSQLAKLTDYTPLFDNLHATFSRFNEFLETAGLPHVELRF